MSVPFWDLKEKNKNRKKISFEYYVQFTLKKYRILSISKGKSVGWQMHNSIHNLKGLSYKSILQEYWVSFIIHGSTLKLSAPNQGRWFSKLQSTIIWYSLYRIPYILYRLYTRDHFHADVLKNIMWYFQKT